MDKKMLFLLLLTSGILLLTGCRSNRYEEYYSPVAGAEYLPAGEQVKLVELADASQIAGWQAADDYILIGTSSFYTLWTPRVFAVDCARKYGASLVVLSYQKGESKMETSVMYMPTSQTTYHYGTVHGRHGRHAHFHGSSTSYGAVPVAINYQNTYYRQTAYFFGKRKYKNPFGVYFQLPENIPGSTGTGIRVSLVAANSPAARQGIKPGDTVVSINGRPVVKEADILPFMNGTEKIERIEVAHE